MTPEDAQRIADDDYTEMARDVLEFNHRAVARGFVTYVDQIRRQHAAEVSRYKNLAGVAEHVAVLLASAQREGRKTVRIDDVLGEAQRRVDAARDAELREMVRTLGAAVPQTGCAL